MSWLEKLFKTYENCSTYIGKDAEDDLRLLPICHTTQNAQIEIVIDGSGNFKTANVISKANKSNAITEIPCTEESGGRAGSKPTCHPLCDKLQYIAGDYCKFGGRVTSGFLKNPNEPHRIYLESLSKWCASPYRNHKVEAIYNYVCNATTIADLIKVGVLHIDSVTGHLLKAWEGMQLEAPEIFNVMQNTASPEDAFVRWIVEITGDNSRKIWEDREVWQSWQDYYLSTKTTMGLCYVTGESIPLSKQHPAKIRHAADKAKLISANDKSGFTYRGRFTDETGQQACGVGFEITQKAHNILRWLIARQGYRNGTQAIISWEVQGRPVPNPLFDTFRMCFSEEEIQNNLFNEIMSGSENDFKAGQEFALRFKRKIGGYRAELGDSSSIVVLAIDSATTGRMSITFYRELQSSEFLDKIEAWHEQCCWLQNFGKNRQFVGAPAPKDIAEVAYGRRLEEKLLNEAISTLLHCIIDAVSIPAHFVENCIRRASNRNGIEYWEWEKALGVACAVYRKYKFKERKYQMALETQYTSRDYLFGRLLAIAENIERKSLGLSNENRETNAGKFLQQFSTNPYATWLIIEKALKPYEMRLRGNEQYSKFLSKMQCEMDSVMSLFKIEDFTSNAKLSGEFLLGYHCQRDALRYKKSSKEVDETIAETNDLN